MLERDNVAKGRIAGSLQVDMTYLNSRLDVDKNFDIIYRVIHIGGKEACMYLIDGFCKDDLVQKLLQYFMDLTPDKMPEDMHALSKQFTPYVEVDIEDKWDVLIQSLLSGMFILLLEGYKKALLIDSRTYPSRGVEEPEKDKTLRGSKDGFVETLVSNTALIRRRIRSTDLHMEMMSAGESSRTDIALCYMKKRVSQDFLQEIREKIRNIKADSLTMNQESLAECLYQRKWYNPFPKFKYTERPDAAAAQVLEGNIVILVDNSPSAMILPTTIFDVIEEADDYYFPPVTGTYLRITRFLITLLTYLVTPTFLLLINNDKWIPESFSFIMLKEEPNLPLIWQFLVLELAIDGLKLAAINTPNMLSTPLSVMAALVLGEFSVNSGWFSSEVMLYMAFVAIANYTQSNYELGYALKFLRIITLLLTQWFNVWGYVGGILLSVLSVCCNRTVSRKSYIYPLIPFDWKALKNRLIRRRLPGAVQAGGAETDRRG
ncbi:spore germination protein [Acetatifactor muris]|jgi:stage V sporulation protein AF|uniref:Spore germination protein A1 n=1 Tax=Acetatifactor muris TaxID=879566 RepID=A0A2K4ZPD8_9FIRM|nr:spore germination protein [Acetatifactor muris]MCR2050725.1 spore germination protein [Acetatifactor muris]SOY32242.1 Spore germination protein A1 [Acetatifactor muris]